VLLIPFAILAASGTTWAAGKDSKERAAKTACLAGDYAKGVALLAELYVSTGEAIYLFNQGRCFQQNGKYEEAIVRFREYQRKNIDAGRAPDAVAEKHIADCREQLAQNKPATPTSPPAQDKPASESAPPPAPLPVFSATPSPQPSSAPADLLAQPETTPAESVSEDRPFYKTWWFWTSVGAAVVAGSVTAFLLTRPAPNACDSLNMKCVGVTGK
jgi:hypothetical protein